MRLKRTDVRLGGYIVAILVGNMILTSMFSDAANIFLLATGLCIGYFVGLWKSGKL